MDHFNRKNGELNCESISINALIEKVGSPAYVYSRATLGRHCEEEEKVLFNPVGVGNYQAIILPKTITEASEDVIQGVVQLVRSYGMGTVVLSTPQGVISGGKAKELNVGGEILCYVW